MDAINTSRHMNSRMSSRFSANSGTMDRKTRMIIPQHRESRIPRTWVQKVMSGSRMTLLERRRARIWHLAISQSGSALLAASSSTALSEDNHQCFSLFTFKFRVK